MSISIVLDVSLIIYDNVGLGGSIIASSTYLHMSPGPEVFRSQWALVILQTEQPEMNTLIPLFSGPRGPHQASCLQRAAATQGPSLRPQRLHLCPVPTAEAIPQSGAGRAS